MVRSRGRRDSCTQITDGQLETMTIESERTIFASGGAGGGGESERASSSGGEQQTGECTHQGKKKVLLQLHDDNCIERCSRGERALD